MSVTQMLNIYFKHQQRPLTLYVGLAVVHGFLLIPLPLLLKYVIDQLHGGALRGILIALALLLGISGLDIVLTAISRIGIVATVKEGIESLRIRLIEKVIESNHREDWQEYEKEIKDIIVHDTERLDIAVTVGLGQALPAAISAIALLGVLFFVSPILWSISFGILPFCVIALIYTKKIVYELLSKFQDEMNRFEGRVGFLVHVWELMKIQVAESVERTTHKEFVSSLRTTSNALARQHIMLQVLQDGMGLLFGVVLLGVGFLLSSLGWMTISQVIAFFVGFSLVRMQIAMIFTTWPQVITLQYVLNRIHQLLTIASTTPYSGTTPHRISGELRMQCISFSREGIDILKNIDATFLAGTMTVITGGNGEGKTTMLLILLGLLVPDSGSVSVDGVSFSEIDMREYRKQIGVVSQEGMFMNATVKENEEYGEWAERESASFEWNGFIIDPHRDVASLSGGEKQRFMIMRALRRKPKILLLDEPTNHLDATYRKVFLGEIKKLLPSTTIICITHDPQLIEIADATYRLANGVLSYESRIPN